MRKLDAEAGRASDQHSTNLAAALVVAAKKEGITRIDDVALSTDNGSRVFAVQSDALRAQVCRSADAAVTQHSHRTKQQGSATGGSAADTASITADNRTNDANAGRARHAN